MVAHIANVHTPSRLSSQQNDVRSKTYATLTRLHTWTSFSNRAGTGSGPSSDAPANSIEAIHDGIHNDVGGGGHMSNPAVAAFDPLFFLHHANVDRVIALWEALNAGVWVIPGSSGGGTWTVAPNVQVDTNSGTCPLHQGYLPSSLTMLSVQILRLSAPRSRRTGAHRRLLRRSVSVLASHPCLCLT